MEPPLQDRTLGQLHKPPSITEERREHQRLRERQRRKAISDAERERERHRARQRRKAMTDEQRERERLRARRRRMVMTDEQREQERIRLRRQRVAMTDEQRELERIRRRRYLINRNEQQISHERERNRLYQRQRRNSSRNEHSDSSEQTTLPRKENTNEHQRLGNTSGNIQEHAQVSSVLHEQMQREAARISAMEVMVINKGSGGDTQKLDIDLNNDLNTPLEGENSEEMNASEGVWRGVLNHVNIYTRAGTTFKVVNGNKVLFWQDNWCSNKVFKDTYPALYKKSSKKNATIEEVNERNNNYSSWNLGINSVSGRQEMEETMQIISDLEDIMLQPDREDERNGQFSVKTCFDWVLQDMNYPSSYVWNSVIPPRISFFVWQASLSSLPTQDSLQRRGMTLVNRCSLCKNKLETADHLLLHCAYATEIWNHFLGLLNLNWSHPRTVLEMLWSWNCKFSFKVSQCLKFCLPFAVFWEIWEERNRRTFEGRERVVSQAITNIKGILFSWVKTLGIIPDLKYQDFAFNWNHILSL